MPKTKSPTEKTERILQIYHLFITCEEVSKQEIRSSIGNEWNDKTISRDIALLKRAAVPVHFSMRRKAYVLEYKSEDEFTDNEAYSVPALPEGKKERQYIEKIMRLTTLMDYLRNMPDDPVEVWYTKTFPEVSKRTMQRDFALMNSILYNIEYKRAWIEAWDKENEQPVGHYYFSEPYPYGF